MNLDVKSLNICDALEGNSGITLPRIPYLENTSVTSIPMTMISPTLFILPPEIIESIPMTVVLPPEIIEADETVIEILYGFDWKQCSCAFDTAKTVLLLYLYLYLSREEREESIQVIPFFGNISKDIVPTSFASLAEAKLKLMRYFMTQQYKINRYYSIFIMISCNVLEV